MAKKNTETLPSNEHLWKTREVSSFLNEEYRDYSLYCAMERCTPSLIDGFKITQRKILHSAFKGACKSGNLVKLLNLTGDTLKETLYAHGDGSLNGGIIGLGQSFSDLLNPLYIEGQSGTLRDQDSVASPRYLYVKLNKFANLYKTDYDLLEFLDEEGQSVEPKYYLPIIPTVLCRQAIGLAPGYRFNTMSYNPIDLIDGCMNHLKGKTIKIPRPCIRGIKQSNWNYVLPLEGSGYWENRGEWEYNFSKDKMVVTDLPYDVGFDDFEKLLNKYTESEFIKDWFNYSEGETIRYEIIFDKGKLKKEAGKTDVHLPNKFKLIKKVPDNQLYVLDENNKVRYFESPVELIKYFTEFRLSVYEDRKTRLLKVLNERLTSNSDMCRFIELIIKGKLKINNRPKNDIKADMKEHKLPEHLIGTPISKLTKEEYEALLKENEDIKREIEYITRTTIEEMYLNDLKNLRKEFINDFPSDSNDTDKVKREKKVNVKTEEKEVKAPVKRKRRTKAEMEAARKKLEKQNKKKK
jgi:DNA topoisomerase-2